MDLRQTLINKTRIDSWPVTISQIIYDAEVIDVEGEPILVHPVDVIGAHINMDQRYYEFNVMDMFWEWIPFEGTFLDIGGNIGNHALMFNRFRPNVTIHSFEPVHKNYIMLYNNTKSKPNIKTYSVGLGDKVEAVKTSQPHSNNRGGIKVDNNGEGEIITIIPGDNLNLTDVAFIKMDVEGYEVNTIRGLNQTINKYKPNIWIEDFTGGAVNELRSMGYEVVMDDGGYGNFMMVNKI